MNLTDQFVTLVEAELEGKPFMIERRSAGFTAGYALADARWVSILQHNDVRDSITYTVRVNETKRRFSINDTLRQLSWRVGATGMIPEIGGFLSIRSGRVKYGRILQLGVAPGGVAVSFSPEQERARIKEIGESLGLRQGMSPAALAGLWTAVGAIGLCVLSSGIVMLVMALTQ